MNKYLLPILCIISMAHAAEEQQIVKREPREWDAAAYAKGNKLQEQWAKFFLQTSKLNLKNKKVVDIGCGTGNITAFIATMAKKAHGIDASNNMIKYAQETHKLIPNLSFEQSFAEEFSPKKRFDVAMSFFCLHWIENKQQTLLQVNHALTTDGEFFGTHLSSSDPEPIHFTVLKELIPTLSDEYSAFKQADWRAGMEYFILSDKEFQSLLLRNGFDIISYEHKSLDLFLTKEELEEAIKPILMSRPFIQTISEDLRNSFFNLYISKVIERLEEQNDNLYIIPAEKCKTRVFHARKRAEILHMPHIGEGL